MCGQISNTFPESTSGPINALDESSRLGEMAGTASVRDRTVRLILEAGDFSTPREREFLQDDDWLRDVYAVAVADGCEDVFGPFPTHGNDKLEKPKPIEGLTGFVANGKLIKEPPPEIILRSGERMEFLNQTARAVRDTPRRQSGRKDAALEMSISTESALSERSTSRRPITDFSTTGSKV